MDFLALAKELRQRAEIVSEQQAAEHVQRLRAIMAREGLTRQAASDVLDISVETLHGWFSNPGTRKYRACPSWAPRLLAFEYPPPEPKKRKRRKKVAMDFLALAKELRQRAEMIESERLHMDSGFGDLERACAFATAAAMRAVADEIAERVELEAKRAIIIARGGDPDADDSDDAGGA